MRKLTRSVPYFKVLRKPVSIVLIIAVLLIPGLPTLPQSAKAQPSSPPFVGRVCIVPGQSTSCPQTLPSFPIQSINSFNVSINILGSTTFNGFDISIQWDFTRLNVTGADLTGTVLPAATLTVDCINGGQFGALGCGSLDGVGVAHIAATGSSTTAPTSGRLFKLGGGAGIGVPISLGFRTGCSTNSVPNVNVCVLVATGPVTAPGTIPVRESIQSQLLGVPLPTALAPSGNVTGTITQGGPPNFADTWVTPYTVTLPGNITTWKVQFMGGMLVTGIGVPAGVQLKVLRRTGSGILTVVGAGTVHDPRPTLISRLPGYPFFLTESSVIEYYSDPGIFVMPGDLIGITIISNSTVQGYFYAGVNGAGTRLVLRNVGLGGTIDLTDPFTASLTGGPALQVFIRVPPPPADTAGDGIPDFVALSPEMQALGVDPCRKTILVQVDYMFNAILTHRPLPQALNNVTSSFDTATVPATLNCPYAGFPLKASGVKLIVDVDNGIPLQGALNFTHSEPQSFDTVKAAHFDPNRVGYFHYSLWVHDLGPQSSVSGIAELFGSDSIISLGEWHNGVGTVAEQAGTFMHELGHNLGLDHGGTDDINFKSNYLSVMNYAFQVVGITRKTSSGDVTRFDYSSQVLPSLNEMLLDESVGIGIQAGNDYTSWICPDGVTTRIGLGRGGLDWNCNSPPAAPTIDPGTVSADINNDTILGTLNGHNDWASLQYQFTISNNFRVGGHTNAPAGKELTFPRALIIEAAWSQFLATTHRSTLTSVTCDPSSASVTSPTTCTVTSTDTDTGTPITPTGTVTFESSQPGSFSPTATCTLAGTGASASCFVTYTPASGSLGPQTISAAYAGDINHLGSRGTTTVTGLLPLAVTAFFTDATPTPLKLDQNGNPKVVVNLGGSLVKSTSPGEIMAWLNITNPGTSPIQSLQVTDTLPVDWAVSPMFVPGSGAIHVYFQNTTGLTRNPDITNASIITVSTSNPEQVTIAITNLSLTAIHHALMPGQTILVSIKLSYSLIGTSQSSSSYPRTYTASAAVGAWIQPDFTDGKFAGQASSFFVAYAKS